MTATLEEFSDFEGSLSTVRQKRIDHTPPSWPRLGVAGADELVQSLERLSIVRKAVEDETAMGLM